MNRLAVRFLPRCSARVNRGEQPRLTLPAFGRSEGANKNAAVIRPLRQVPRLKRSHDMRHTINPRLFASTGFADESGEPYVPFAPSFARFVPDMTRVDR